MHPILPNEIATRFPIEVVRLIYSFLPPNPKKKGPSPSFERELKKLQSIQLKGKNQMYMRDLDDFILD